MHRRATKFVKDSPEGHTCVYVYQMEGRIEFTRKPLLMKNKLH